MVHIKYPELPVLIEIETKYFQIKPINIGKTITITMVPIRACFASQFSSCMLQPVTCNDSEPFISNKIIVNMLAIMVFVRAYFSFFATIPDTLL